MCESVLQEGSHYRKSAHRHLNALFFSESSSAINVKQLKIFKRQEQNYGNGNNNNILL